MSFLTKLEAGATRWWFAIRLQDDVQAHVGAYCSPRINNAEKYTHVEIGFPSQKEELLMDWCEEANNPTETVYGYVPVQVVNTVLAKHGGIVEGEVPRGVAPIPAKFTVDIC